MIYKPASPIVPMNSTPSVAIDKATHSTIGWRPSGKFAVSNATRNNVPSFLFMLGAEQGRVTCIRLHPSCSKDLGIRLKIDQERDYLAQTMQDDCRAV